MKIAIFGATGSLGRECLQQCLEAGHEVTVLARTPSKLPIDVRDRIQIVEGDGLDAESVSKTLSGETEAVLFGDRRHDLVVLSDEIHADLLFDGRTHVPFASLGENVWHYEVDGDQLHLAIDGKSSVATLHIRRVGERVLLLNTENLAEYERTGEYNDCTLTLAPEEAQ